MGSESPYKNLSRPSNELFGTALGLSVFYVAAWLFGSFLVSKEAAESQIGIPQHLVGIAGSTGAVYFALLLIVVLGGACIYALSLDLKNVQQRSEWNPPARLYLIAAVAAIPIDFVAGAPLLILVVGTYAIHRRMKIG